jgi:hypothetical protein
MLSATLWAQDVPLASKLWLEGKVHYGFVVPHHENMVHMTSQHLCMFEADVVEASNGYHYWEQQHKYPLKGISLLYSDLGGARYLGKVVAVIPYLNFRLTKGNRIDLFFRFGAGVGYLTKHFERTENYKDIAIGSHFNAAIQMMYEMRWKPFKRLDVTAGLGLTHFSNGAIKTPNLGINILTLSAGCAWKLNKEQAQKIAPDAILDVTHKWEFCLYGIFGFSELYAAYGPKYYAYIFSGTALHTIGFRHKRWMGAGVDVFYDEANVESLKRLGTPVTHRAEVIRPGVNFTHKMDFSRLSLLMQLGVYVYTKFKKDGILYDRLALQYRFGKHYLVHLGLKTHLFTADMIEYGVGYRF